MNTNIPIDSVARAAGALAAWRVDLSDPEAADPAAGCGAAATAVVEAYTPTTCHPYGSLDEARYVCAAHMAATTEAISAAVMTPYRTTDQVPNRERRCGDRFDYTAMRLVRCGMSTAIGVARVPGRNLRIADTAAWPVLGRVADVQLDVGDEVWELVERINRKIAAGELTDRDQDLLREMVSGDEWEGAHECAAATVNGSELTAEAKRDALAVLDRLPREVVEDVADELVELWCSGWVEGAARTAQALPGGQLPGQHRVPDPYQELAELAAAFTRRVARAGLVDDHEHLGALAEQVRHLAEKVDQATTAAEIMRRVDRPVDPEAALRAALLRFYDAKRRENATAYAEGMVGGCAIGSGVDPNTGEPAETEPGEHDSRYLGGYADGLAGRPVWETDARYRSGHADGLTRRTEFVGELDRPAEGGDSA